MNNNLLFRYWQAIDMGWATILMVVLFWACLITGVTLGCRKKLRPAVRALQLAWCFQCIVVFFNGFRCQNTIRSWFPDLDYFLLNLSNAFLMLEVACAAGLIALVVVVACNWVRSHILDYSAHCIILILLWATCHTTQLALLGKTFFGGDLF